MDTGRKFASHNARIESIRKAHITPPVESSRLLVDPFCLGLADGGDVTLVFEVAFLTSVGNACVVEVFVAAFLLAFTFTRGVG
jgi:hypothetical protein